jgi:hypothetical protein
MLSSGLIILFYVIKHKKNKKSLMGLSPGRRNHKTKLLPTSSSAQKKQEEFNGTLTWQEKPQNQTPTNIFICQFRP